MKNKIVIAVCVSMLMFVPACNNEDLLDLNIDPNASNEIDLKFLFAKGQLEVAGSRYENWRANLIYSSTMIQHNASNAGYWSGDKYLYNAGYSSSQWDRYYPDALETLTHVMDRTKDVPESANLNAMATITRCFAMHRLTDLYGAIPYTEAGRGLEGQEFWFPAYDSQSDVYAMLITDLRAARDAMSAGGDDVGVQDVIYGGDVEKWQKFANSLLVRIGMRMSNVDAATAQSTVEEAVAHSAGVFTSNADNAMILNVEANGHRNGNSEAIRDFEFNNARPSATFVSWMVNGNDPRLMIICGGTGDSQDPGTWDTNPASQRGMPNGYDSDTAPAKAVADGIIAAEGDYDINLYSFLNPLLYNYGDPTYFVSHADVSLALAEAKLNGWNVGSPSAQDYFEAGVRSAIDVWVDYDASLTVATADVDAYLTSLDFAGASSAAQEVLIGEQYWASTYFNHYEAYANWRRTDIPALTPTNYSGNVTGGQIPRRLIYPQGEISGNPDNYASAIAAQGPDVFMTRLWWDQ